MRRFKGFNDTGRRATLVSGLVCLVLLGTAAAASADTLTVTVDPSAAGAGQTPTVTASGQASGDNPLLDVLVSPVSVGCAPDYAAESSNADAAVVSFDSPPFLSPGPFSFSAPLATDIRLLFFGTGDDQLFGPAGQYVLCGYLYNLDPSSGTFTTYATASAPFTLRNPNDSISIAPVLHATAGSFAKVPIGYYMEPGTTNASLNVAAYPTRLAVDCSSISIGGEAGGQSSFALTPGNHTVEYPAYDYGPGTYTLCAQIYAGPDAILLTAASSTLTLAAGRSTGPAGGPTRLECRVPDVVGERLARARRALTRNHCSVGSVTRRTRRGHRDGSVVSQSVKPGKRLPDHASINLVVAK